MKSSTEIQKKKYATENSSDFSFLLTKCADIQKENNIVLIVCDEIDIFLHCWRDLKLY